jgi:PAS domain S-box-containing protein
MAGNATAQKYKELFNNALVGIFRFKLEDGKILECNNRFLEIFEFKTKKEAKAVESFFDMNADPKVCDHNKKKLMRDGFVHDFEAEWRGFQGRHLWGRCSVKIGRCGKVVDGIFIDITERKFFEEKFKLLFDYSSDAILILDSEANLVDCNQMAIETFGYESKQELIDAGLPKIRLYKENFLLKKDVTSYIHEFVEYHNPTFEAEHTRLDGTTFLAEVNVNKIDLKPESLFQIIIKDITETKKYEKQLLRAKIAAEEGNRTKSVFLANISHELRSPLTPIIGYSSETIRNWDHIAQNWDGNQGRFLGMMQSISDNSKHLLAVINDLLDISRIETGKVELHLREYFLPEAVESAFNSMKRLAREKSIEFSLIGDLPDVDYCMIGDPDRLRQILTNLIHNAIKFTEDNGKISVKVLVDDMPEEFSRVRFAVSDTGIGIPKGKVKKIFEPFEQLSPKKEGSGLGLSICDKLVSLMSDHPISVESQLGKGSTFSFSIIQKKGALRVDECGIVPEEDENGQACHILRILVVDDSESTQDMLTHFLNKYNHETVSVWDGTDAIEEIRKRYYDVILMDMAMRIMDGTEATKIIRKLGYSLPIIAVTAKVYDQDRETCLKSGMNDYISKPIEGSHVLNQIVCRNFKEFMKAIDWDVALRRHDNDVEFLKESLKKFFERFEKRFEIMSAQLEMGECEDLIRNSHTLKGEASQLAMEPVRQICFNIEQNGADKKMARGAKVALIAELLGDLQRKIKDAKEEFDRHE